jgi:hypothetical protein
MPNLHRLRWTRRWRAHSGERQLAVGVGVRLFGRWRWCTRSGHIALLAVVWTIIGGRKGRARGTGVAALAYAARLLRRWAKARSWPPDRSVTRTE